MGDQSVQKLKSRSQGDGARYHVYRRNACRPYQPQAALAQCVQPSRPKAPSWRSTALPFLPDVCRGSHLIKTLSNDSPRTEPPFIDVLTLRLNPSRLFLRSSAASLFNGSEALGSRKRNYPHGQRCGCATMRTRVTHLQANNDRVQVQHRLPVFSEDVQAHVAFQINVGVVDLLLAFHFGRVVRIVLVDVEVEVKRPGLVHALVRLDAEHELQLVVGIRERRLHRRAQSHLREICTDRVSQAFEWRMVTSSRTLLDSQLSRRGFLLLGSLSSSSIFSLLLLLLL